MSESINAADTSGSAPTPQDVDAKSRRKRILLFSLLALTVAAVRGRLLHLLETRRLTLCVDRQRLHGR